MQRTLLRKENLLRSIWIGRDVIMECNSISYVHEHNNLSQEGRSVNLHKSACLCQSLVFDYHFPPIMNGLTVGLVSAPNHIAESSERREVLAIIESRFNRSLPDRAIHKSSHLQGHLDHLGKIAEPDNVHDLLLIHRCQAQCTFSEEYEDVLVK